MRSAPTAGPRGPGGGCSGLHLGPPRAWNRGWTLGPQAVRPGPEQELTGQGDGPAPACTWDAASRGNRWLPEGTTVGCPGWKGTPGFRAEHCGCVPIVGPSWASAEPRSTLHCLVAVTRPEVRAVCIAATYFLINAFAAVAAEAAGRAWVRGPAARQWGRSRTGRRRRSCLPPPAEAGCSLGAAGTADVSPGFCPAGPGAGAPQPSSPGVAPAVPPQRPRALACGSVQVLLVSLHAALASFCLPLRPPPPALAVSPHTHNLTAQRRRAGPRVRCRPGLLSAVCSASCPERCPNSSPLGLPRGQSLLLPRAAALGCVLPPSVLGLERLPVEPPKTPNSQRTPEKQPSGRAMV